MPKPERFFLLFIAGILFCASCTNMKSALYFNGIGDSTIASTYNNVEPVIHKNDLLSISITSLNPEASQIFNLPGGTSPQSAGTLVDLDGNIQIPYLGNIKAAGTTKSQLKENIRRRLVDAKLLMEPIVNVRFINFRVTVIGEVGRPGVINAPGEKITMLEAIGMAGDLTLTANRTNIMVIRETEEMKQTKRVDLSSAGFFRSPYYYLKPNDIIYVEPSKTKVASTGRYNVFLPIVISTVSLAILVIDRVIQ